MSIIMKSSIAVIASLLVLANGRVIQPAPHTQNFYNSSISSMQLLSRRTESQLPFNITRDGNFLIEIAIGSPNQFLPVFIDWSSPVSWLVGPNCDATSCPAYCQSTAFCGLVCEAYCCKPLAPPTLPPPTCTTSTPEDISTTTPTAETAILAKADDAPDSSCGASTTYDPTGSNKYKPDGRAFITQYKGRRVTGKLDVDAITIGYDPANSVVQLRDAIFGEATKVPPQLLGGQSAGVFGLGEGQSTEKVKSVVVQAADAEVLARASYNVWFNTTSPNINGNDGILTVGAEDGNNCFATRTHTATNLNSSINVTGYTIDGAETVDNLTAAINFQIDEIVARTELIEQLVKSAGAVYNETYESYFVDCDRKIELYIWLDESIGISSHALLIDENVLIHSPVPSICTLNVRASDTIATDFVFGRAIGRNVCVYKNISPPEYSFYLRR